MKKCEYFKELILTDYIDGELDKNSAGDVEHHLFECSDCRAFLKEVKGNVAIFSVSGSANVLCQPVPLELWGAIKQNIEREVETPLMASLRNFFGRLKGLMALPRMVPVFASLILMLLVGSVSLNTIQLKAPQTSDQGEYLISLLSSTEASALPENSDLGTPIEHYFL